MRFISAPLDGVFILELDKHEDERGFFARTFCREEFLAHGLAPDIDQCSISYNRTRGTLRGLHWQVAPHEEIKVVRCIGGAVFDAVVDMRPESGTRGQYYAVELDEENRKALYIPKGVAHGFQTLRDDTTLLYQISSPYRPESARTLRWDDPFVRISWPYPEAPVISDKDRDAPFLSDYE